MKFKVGDKVRITKEEMPPPVTAYGVGEYDTIHSIDLRENGYKLRYSGGLISGFIWFDDELAIYNGTESA